MDAECGSTRGCFVDCKDDGCNYVITWKQNGDWIEFSLDAKIDPKYNRPWIAIAFSSDLKMVRVFDRFHQYFSRTTFFSLF